MFNRGGEFQTQGCIRTIISRAYYASFLHSREFLIKKCQENINEDEMDVHKQVHDLLLDNGYSKEVKILKDLKKNRKIADYKINNNSLTVTTAQFAIHMCENIMESLVY